ncbi:unnamed protein product [Mesocestoides corti]|uniref:Uncharacterized protein n=1 Tax=Mesocestoides corti TaxID=53468 RepID=A0A0R3UD17_MESCO|nr:unnamed protein product [Mesocestoides corti]
MDTEATTEYVDTLPEHTVFSTNRRPCGIRDWPAGFFYQSSSDALSEAAAAAADDDDDDAIGRKINLRWVERMSREERLFRLSDTQIAPSPTPSTLPGCLRPVASTRHDRGCDAVGRGDVVEARGGGGRKGNDQCLAQGEEARRYLYRPPSPKQLPCPKPENRA